MSDRNELAKADRDVRDSGFETLESGLWGGS